MKKQILSVGKALDKSEQRMISGGRVVTATGGGGFPGGGPIFADECSSNIPCNPSPIGPTGCSPAEVCVVFDFGAVCQCLD